MNAGWSAAEKEDDVAVTVSDESRLKELLEEALVEVLDRRREWFSALIADALEDMALVAAIREGESTPVVSRDEVFELLEG
jgi:hypothetical protein